MHKEIRKKLDDKYGRCIVINCLPRGVYRVWNIDQKKIFESRHIVINENIIPANMAESSPYRMM